MRAPAKHCARHDVDERPRIHPALADDGDHLAEHLQRRRAHHVAEQFDEVCVSRIGTDHKSPLSQNVENWLTAFDVGRGAGGDNEQLARLGGIGIAEHRRSYVALPVPCVLVRQLRRGRRANGAHRQMDRSWIQPCRQASHVKVAAAEHDIARGGVVRQHADDDLAMKQVIDIRCRPETECLEPVDLLRAADIGDHLSSRGHEICSHRRSHATEADKADLLQRRPAPGGQFRGARLLARRTCGRTFQGERRARFFLGHEGS